MQHLVATDYVKSRAPNSPGTGDKKAFIMVNAWLHARAAIFNGRENAVSRRLVPD
jgi:hypothetical protein